MSPAARKPTRGVGRRGGRRVKLTSGFTTSGFTMVELLLALAVAGLVTLAAYAMVGFAADATRRLRETGRSAAAGATTRITLEGWLRAATLLDGAVPFVGSDRGSSELPRDEVAFGVAHAGARDPGPHRIRLWVDRDRGTPAAGLVAELAPIRNGVLAPAETLELAPEAIGLALRYKGRLAGKERWLDIWESSRQLPMAVELRLVSPSSAATRGSAAGLPPLLTMPLVVRLGWVSE